MKKLSKKDKKEILRFIIIVLVSMAVVSTFIVVSIASDKKCNENHSAEFCRQQ